MRILEFFKRIISDFKSSLSDAFIETYAADGVDPVKGTINESKEDYNSEAGKAYIYHILTILAGLVGWPNRRLDNNAGQSWRNLGRNFIGRQKDVSKTRNVVNALIVTPINIIALPFKFVRNILKLGTEVVPETLGKFFLKEGTRLSTYSLTHYLDLLRDKSKTTGQKFLPVIGHFSLFVLSLMFTAVGIGCHAVGTFLKNFTSPISNVRKAWHAGKALGGDGWGGTILGSVFAGTTACSILALYGIAFVGGVVLTATTAVGPWLASHMSEGAAAFMASFITAVSPVSAAVGHFVMPLVTFVAKGLTASIGVNIVPVLTAMPGVVGFGGIVGGLVATVGSGINKLASEVKSWWYKSLRPAPKPVTEVAPVLVKNSTTQKLSTRLTDAYGKNTLDLSKEPKIVEFKSARASNENLSFLVAKQERDDKKTLPACNDLIKTSYRPYRKY